MDNCEPRNTENFEEMTVSKFNWLLRDVCAGLPSLKKASKHQAIHGIILSLIFLVLGVVTGWLLISDKIYFEQRICYNLAFGFGATFLVVGTLLLIYSLVLLRSFWNDQGFRVYQIIKGGCLILLYLELIIKLIIFIGMVILLAYQDLGSVLIPAEGFLVLHLFLTVLAIFAIHNVRPKIVSLYIFITAILSILMIIFFSICAILLFRSALLNKYFAGFFDDYYGWSRRGAFFPNWVNHNIIVFLILSFFFVLFLVSLMTDYYLKIFALHVNMMTITPVNNLYHVNC